MQKPVIYRHSGRLILPTKCFLTGDYFELQMLSRNVHKINIKTKHLNKPGRHAKKQVIYSKTTKTRAFWNVSDNLLIVWKYVDIT